MFESLRAFGYELATALADLIDNSVFAGTRNVWIDFEWDGEPSNICFTDDGCGMTEEELVNTTGWPWTKDRITLARPTSHGAYKTGVFRRFYLLRPATGAFSVTVMTPRGGDFRD
jgi:hypothetical protein